MTSATLRLVLHADDFGMNRAVSDGIVLAFRYGLLTSTSLLANAADAERALQQWKELARDRAAGNLPSMAVRKRLGDPDQAFDLGVHLNLTQGRPLTASYPAELLDRHGRFPGVFSLLMRLRRRSDAFRAAIQAELDRQVQFVRDHGLQPTHLNGHQYIEMIPALSGLLPELMERHGVGALRVACEPALLRSTLRSGLWKWPLARVKRAFARRYRERVAGWRARHPDVYFGTAHAGGIDLPLLRLFLAAAPQEGLVEVGLHPGESAATPPEETVDGWRDPLAAARPDELRMLLSAELAVRLEAAGCRLGRL